jgi:hypothetical protein
MQVQLFASLKILKTLTAVGSKLRLHRFLSHCCGQFFKLLMISFLSVLWQATAFFNWEYHELQVSNFTPAHISQILDDRRGYPIFCHPRGIQALGRGYPFIILIN